MVKSQLSSHNDHPQAMTHIFASIGLFPTTSLSYSNKQTFASPVSHSAIQELYQNGPAPSIFFSNAA